MIRMLRYVAPVLAVLALVIFAGSAFAVDAKGKIKTVTADKHEFVMTDSDGKNWTMTCSKETKILVNDKESKLADLQADDEVTVTYEKDGEKMVASSIKATRK